MPKTSPQNASTIVPSLVERDATVWNCMKDGRTVLACARACLQPSVGELEDERE